MTFFEPSPVFLAFIFAKTFVYLEVLALLALIRAIGATGPARLAAFLAFVGATAGLGVIFAPALSLNTGAVYTLGARFLAWGNGVLPLLILSAPLVISAIVSGTRWRWIDIVHCAGIASIGALWFATLI